MCDTFSLIFVDGRGYNCINWYPWINLPFRLTPPCFRPIRKIKNFFLPETSKNQQILLGLKNYELIPTCFRPIRNKGGIISRNSVDIIVRSALYIPCSKMRMFAVIFTKDMDPYANFYLRIFSGKNHPLTFRRNNMLGRVTRPPGPFSDSFLCHFLLLDSFSSFNQRFTDYRIKSFLSTFFFVSPSQFKKYDFGTIFQR